MLANHFTDDVFDKSQKYGKDKAKFSLVTGLYKQCLDSAMLQFGMYAWSWSVAGRALAKFGYGSEYEASALVFSCNRKIFFLLSCVLSWSLPSTFTQISQSLVFVALLFMMSTIPDLPTSVYHTFVLEEKHGFNKTTPGLFVADLLKGWALGFAIGAPFLATFLYIFKWAGDRFVPWLMGFM